MDENYIIPFGKHKGEKLKDVPTGYLVYLYDRKMVKGELKEWIEQNIPIIIAQLKARNK